MCSGIIGVLRGDVNEILACHRRYAIGLPRRHEDTKEMRKYELTKRAQKSAQLFVQQFQARLKTMSRQSPLHFFVSSCLRAFVVNLDWEGEVRVIANRRGGGPEFLRCRGRWGVVWRPSSRSG